jgi:hypothetical protein
MAVRRLEDWDALEQGYTRLNYFSNTVGKFLLTYCGELIDGYKIWRQEEGFESFDGEMVASNSPFSHLGSEIMRDKG